MKPGWTNWDRRLPGAALLGTDPEIAALIAEETRVSMLIGVAVGYELARTLSDPKD